MREIETVDADGTIRRVQTRWDSTGATSDTIELVVPGLRDDPHPARDRPHVLAPLVGRALYAVTFSMQGIGLEFESARPLQLYVDPRVHRAGTVLRPGEAGWAEALIALVTVQLEAVDELLDRGLVLDFAGGVRLAVPRDGTDHDGPETAEWHDADGSWMVWRPGDEPVAWMPQG